MTPRWLATRPITIDEFGEFCKLPSWWRKRIGEICDPVLWGAAEPDGKLIGVVGLMRDPTLTGSVLGEIAPLLVFLDIEDAGDRDKAQWLATGCQIVVEIARGMARLDIQEPVWAQCDASFRQAPRLLKALKFSPTTTYRRDFRGGGGADARMLQMWRKG